MGESSGYFSSKSLLLRVHRERVVGVFYGQRALMIGATNPLNYFITAMHSRSRRRPFYRLARTAEMIETIIFASQTEADKVLAAVYGVHRRAEGRLPVRVGQHAASSHYSALDPDNRESMTPPSADDEPWAAEDAATGGRETLPLPFGV